MKDQEDETELLAILAEQFNGKIDAQHARDRAIERFKNADNEISRLATENWKLRERLKESDEVCLKLRKRLKDR